MDTPKIIRSGDITYDLYAIGILLFFYIIVVFLDFFCNNPLNRKFSYKRKRICNWTVIGYIRATQLMTISAISMLSFIEGANSNLDVNSFEFDIIYLVSLFVLPISTIFYGQILERTGARLYLFINTFIQAITCFAFGTILMKYPNSYEGEIFLFFFQFITVVLSGPTEISLNKINASWYRTDKERAFLVGILPIFAFFSSISSAISKYSYFHYSGSVSLLYSCAIALLLASVFSFFIQNSPQDRDFETIEDDHFLNHHTITIKEMDQYTPIELSFREVFLSSPYIPLIFLGIICYGFIGDYFQYWMYNVIISYFQLDTSKWEYIFGSATNYSFAGLAFIFLVLLYTYVSDHIFLWTSLLFLICGFSISGVLVIEAVTNQYVAWLCFIFSIFLRFFKEGIIATKRYYSMTIGGYKWTGTISSLFDSAIFLGQALTALLFLRLRTINRTTIVIMNTLGVVSCFMGFVIFGILYIYKTVKKTQFSKKYKF